MKSFMWYLKNYFFEIMLITMLIAVIINNRSLLWP